jgi:aryl-alcohol dehydrogenase-like predicted oxidoreductase
VIKDGRTSARPRKAIAEAILRHIQANPLAADTLDGIYRSWLPPGLEFTHKEIAEALDELVAKGRMSARLLPGGATLYQAATSECPPSRPRRPLR